MKQRVNIADISFGLWLATLIFLLSFLSMNARAQPAIDPAPFCNAFTQGKGLRVGAIADPPTVAVSWWCAPADQWGSWRPSKAAVSLGAENREKILALIGARDMAGLVAQRNVSVNSPQFAVVWRLMAADIAASKPPGPWVVKPSGRAIDRPVVQLVNGVLVPVKTRTVPVGATCDCVAGRYVSGALTYCRAGPVALDLAVCVKLNP